MDPQTITVVTLGEVNRNVEKLDASIKAALDSMVHRDVYAAEKKLLEQRLDTHAEEISDLKDSRRWTFRMAVAALVGAAAQCAFMLLVK